MNLPIIQSLWIGDDLSNLEKLCVQSFLDHGHEFHLYTYADIGGIPSGAIVKDGNDILPADKIFRYKRGSTAGFSNRFRYELLAKFGGWWVDMDTVCLNPFDFTDEIILPECFNPNGQRAFQTNPIKFPIRHEFMVAMAKHYLNSSQEGATTDRIGGPIAFTEKIKEWKLEKYGKPFCYFHSAVIVTVLFDNSFREGLVFHPNAYALHIYNSQITDLNFDKDAIYDKHSAYEQLKTKHGIKNLPNSSRVPSLQFNKMWRDSTFANAERNNKNNKRRQLRERILYALLIASSSAIIVLVLS